jgi:16S rRNA (guanine527-N7)-methyltransferase
LDKDKVKRSKHELQNGILYLKEDLTEEKDFPKATQYDLADFFEDEFLKLRKWCMCL